MRTSKKEPLASAQGDKKRKGEKTSPLPPLKGEKKRRKVKLPEHSRLNKKLIKEFDNFLEYAPPERLSRNLRNMFLMYLSHEQDGLPNNFKDTIIDFYLLLEFLDNSAEELREKKTQ
jgi:hypothetical protein